MAGLGGSAHAQTSSGFTASQAKRGGALYGEGRKGDNLYSDSIVALNADTGKLAWYHQEIKHDVWDYDAASNVVLFDVQQNAETIPAAGNAGKDGWFHIVHRRDGKLIRKSDPFVMQSKNMFSAPTKEGVELLPGANGGAEWSPPAYSPQTGYMYVMGMNQLMSFATEDPGYSKGTIRLGSSFTNVKKGAIQNGVFSAIDVNTGKIAWHYDAPQPLIGGVLATAGGLVFMGEGNGYFDAFDARLASSWGASTSAPASMLQRSPTRSMASSTLQLPPAATSRWAFRTATWWRSSR